VRDEELSRLARAGVLRDQLTLFFEMLTNRHSNVNLGPWEAAKVAAFVTYYYELIPRTDEEEIRDAGF
jgi:hypothetical protein